MRLKNLELQGYKTFATRTDFTFDGGITAIVGPNGSGKSNIADAIRWVLGEQSYRSLRGKRTEDMIFSGSAQRARLGMALVTLVLDNSDGKLPIDFAEVTISRRAYRSGENEYLLNGSRVRLRDISELLSQSGLAQRTYTVIGQGLVDAVLSLRAEDRRALFEEAAGISLFQSKRAEAVSRLEETRSNLLRVSDIINEIAPRLRRLEREAERAEHQALLTEQLQGLLRTWYGFRWHEEQLNLQRARDAVARRQDRLDRFREGLLALDQQAGAFRARQSQLRAHLGGWHRESSELHGHMEELQRDLAVWRERARLLARQRDELQAELVALVTQAQAAAERVSAAETDLARDQAALTDSTSLVARAQTEMDAHEQERAALSRRLGQARACLLNLDTQSADRRNRLDQMGERQAALAQERGDHLAAIELRQRQAAELGRRLEDLLSEQVRIDAASEELAGEDARLAAARAEVQVRESDLRASLAGHQRTVERLQGRYELLSRLRAEGEGLRGGVRAILQATGSLSGVVGTVSQLLDVPAEVEVAIEVALGGHLQDLVMASWSDAEAAIAFLRSGRRGRATFLPLDTVRPAPRLDLPHDPGLVGVAADLVRAEARLAPVVEMLLGRTIVAGDLAAARRIFGRLRGGFQIVTLGGEVLRSSGSVTGGEGQNQLQGQVLAREREWRRLPGQIEKVEEQCRSVEGSLDDCQATGQGLQAQRTTVRQRQEQVEKDRAVVQGQRLELERDMERAAQELTWRQELVARLDEEEAGLGSQQAALGADLQRLATEHQVVEGELSSVQADLDQLRGDVLYQRLSEARTAEAVARGAWEHRRATLAGLREAHAQVQDQLQAKRQRTAELEAEQEGLAGQIEAQSSREAVVRGWLASLAQKIDPAEAEMLRLDKEREALEGEETTLRARLRDAESRHAQALLQRSRQEDRLDRLRQQVMDDFGLVEMEPTEGLPEQPPLPLGELVSALPSVESLPEGLEEEVHQIKAQVRRMGSVNPNAPDEYAEVLDRYSFLVGQTSDLEEAASGLRQVISELDEVMRAKFQATFQQVAARFKDNFAQLFGGGSARLVLTEPDDISLTGVEIVAQPPGRRQQTLALLSGGERSLTAVALVFALLEVSAPPFCVLDEVDAMLDEANVRRFRQALESLALQTQFIVITHNRRTIEAADTIYGVSMGDDSVSQVVSLRLEGDKIAAPDGSAVDVAKDG